MADHSRLRTGLILAGLGALAYPLAILPALLDYSLLHGAGVLLGFLLFGTGLIASGWSLPRTLRQGSVKNGLLSFLPAAGAILLASLTWHFPVIYAAGLILIGIGALLYGFGAGTWDATSDVGGNLFIVRFGAFILLTGALFWSLWYLLLFTPYRTVSDPAFMIWEAGALMMSAGLLWTNLGLRIDRDALKTPHEAQDQGHPDHESAV